MINQKLQDFEEEVKPLGDIMTQVFNLVVVVVVLYSRKLDHTSANGILSIL